MANLLIVYGVDGCLTIIHRIMLHENLGEAHRKHAYQIMANELKIGQVKVASFYALLQLAVSFGFVYLCPVLAAGSGLSLVAWHRVYVVVAGGVGCGVCGVYEEVLLFA